VYAVGGGLGSEITPWVEWVTGDEALGPIVGADSNPSAVLQLGVVQVFCACLA
jgi:hypothetical protein